MFVFSVTKLKSTIGVCQIVKALLRLGFRSRKNKMNAKLSCFYEKADKNSFGLPNRVWKAALGKGFQGVLLQQR